MAPCGVKFWRPLVATSLRIPPLAGTRIPKAGWWSAGTELWGPSLDYAEQTPEAQKALRLVSGHTVS